MGHNEHGEHGADRVMGFGADGEGRRWFSFEPGHLGGGVLRVPEWVTVRLRFVDDHAKVDMVASRADGQERGLTAGLLGATTRAKLEAVLCQLAAWRAG